MEIVNLLLVAIGFFCLGSWWSTKGSMKRRAELVDINDSLLQSYKRQEEADTELIRALQEELRGTVIKLMRTETELLQVATLRRIEKSRAVSDPVRGGKKPDGGEMN
jgi:hypothetical protein